MSDSQGLERGSSSLDLIAEELTLEGRSPLQELNELAAAAELELPVRSPARPMGPTFALLSRPHALDGVGLLALSSALIGPLSLEVIYTHRELWFESPAGWQAQGLSLLWRVWLLLGSILLVGWGLNRAATGGVAGYAPMTGVEGLTYVPNPQRYYASLVTLIGSLVYLLFGIPTWIWVSRLGLSAEESLLYQVGVSVLSLILIPQVLSFASASSKRREWVLLMLGMVWVWLISRWVWELS